MTEQFYIQWTGIKQNDIKPFDIQQNDVKHSEMEQNEV